MLEDIHNEDNRGFSFSKLFWVRQVFFACTPQSRIPSHSSPPNSKPSRPISSTEATLLQAFFQQIPKPKGTISASQRQKPAPLYFSIPQTARRVGFGGLDPKPSTLNPKKVLIRVPFNNMAISASMVVSGKWFATLPQLSS